jgi:enoyl-[acyl-carrier protein] reductase/trans-2-enoyl-CoA reductase (NAD+)
MSTTFALPKFQFRFIPSMGNVIHPGNFHPVGTRRGAARLVDRALKHASNTREAGAPAPTPGAGGRWLLIGGSGGFGSAARVTLGAAHGAHTLNLSFDAEPNLESRNKMRKLGSPGWHRSRAIERRLRELELVASSLSGDAFDPECRARTIAAIRELLPGGQIDGIIWALAAPRGLDPRTGKKVASALKPIGQPVEVKTFSSRAAAGGSQVVEFTMAPGTPEEAVRTQYVMGGRIVEQWVTELRAANVLAKGVQLVTISYRGNELNAGIYRRGLIGLAKADLEFHTAALDAQLRATLGGRAVAVEGPAVVTEASGGIPGVPFYMAMLLDVMGAAHEDPLACMLRMFSEKLSPTGAREPVLDEQGLLRMDDRELAEAVQDEMSARDGAFAAGDRFPDELYDKFLTAYAQTRGFDIEGVDYEAEIDVHAR